MSNKAQYAFMCHFYGNALSILTVVSKNTRSLKDIIQPYHLEVIRMLPSFRKLIDRLLRESKADRVRRLLEEDQSLIEEIESALESQDRKILRLLRALHVFGNAMPGNISRIDLYVSIFGGTFSNAEYLKRMLESIKRMLPEDLIVLVRRIKSAIETGGPDMDLEGWADDEQYFIGELQDMETKTLAMTRKAIERGKPIRSSEAIHSKGLRTTVVAQRVQLTHEKSTITEEETKFIGLVERLTGLLESYFTPESPKNIFLNETWLCDSSDSLLSVFAPRPRAAIENALSAPREYLTCNAGAFDQRLSSTQPATAILYQIYLEAGPLINIADLWTTFYDILSGKAGDECDERESLMQFYRALADLKMLGMVKQSKKKTDHLAKVAWKSL